MTTIILDVSKSVMYERIFVKDINDTRLKYTGPSNAKQYKLFISDHFGVWSSFEFI